MKPHVWERLENSWSRVAETWKDAASKIEMEEQKLDGEAEGFLTGENSHLMTLVVAVKKLAKAAASNEGQDPTWGLRGTKRLHKNLDGPTA